jgi:hypothetical protein
LGHDSGILYSRIKGDLVIAKQKEDPTCGKCGKIKTKHEILSYLCDECDPESLINKPAKIQKQKPPVDDLKKRMAEEIIGASIRSAGQLRICAFCNDFQDREKDIKHMEDCVVAMAKSYLEGLDGI